MLNKFYLYTVVLLLTLNCYSQKEGWLIGHGQVIEKAAQENKPILVNFTGSDWCGWCIRLDKAVFQTDEFKKWAKENVILLEIDNPKRTSLSNVYGISEEEGYKLKNENDYLQNLFQVRGFPTIWIFSVSKRDDGKFSITTQQSGPYSCRMGYESTATKFIEKANSHIKRIDLLNQAHEEGLDCSNLSNRDCEDYIKSSKKN